MVFLFEMVTKPAKREQDPIGKMLAAQNIKPGDIVLIKTAGFMDGPKYQVERVESIGKNGEKAAKTRMGIAAGQLEGLQISKLLPGNTEVGIVCGSKAVLGVFSGYREKRKIGALVLNNEQILIVDKEGKKRKFDLDQASSITVFRKNEFRE